MRIIGIGSPYGADQLGWLAIDYLETCSLVGCELIKLDRPGSGLLNYLQDADHVVLIDALISSGKAGDVTLISLGELESQHGLTSSHGFGVAETLALAGQLGLPQARLSLIGIYIQDDPSHLPVLNTTALERLVAELL